jgi:hypothetical protein
VFQQLPLRLIELVMPYSSSKALKSRLAYWLLSWARSVCQSTGLHRDGSRL